jgi:hypothetical protein
MPPLTQHELIRLAVLKQRLNDELIHVREQMKGYPYDELPFSVRVGDRVVTVGKPQYRGGVPSVKVTANILPPIDEVELEAWVTGQVERLRR